MITVCSHQLLFQYIVHTCFVLVKSHSKIGIVFVSVDAADDKAPQPAPASLVTVGEALVCVVVVVVVVVVLAVGAAAATAATICNLSINY